MDTSFSITVKTMFPYFIFVLGLLIGVVITKIDEYYRKKEYIVEDITSTTITVSENHNFKLGDKIRIE